MINMSTQTNPLLYLNMGGEMLYVLRQRLKAQSIPIDKSVRVMNEVTASLLDPHVISKLFQQSGPIDLTIIRYNLESAILSSIMRLDKTSMDKLFHLMIMMVKYQIQMVTGPRELLLVTLNHIDSMKETLADLSMHQSLILVHRMLLQLYGNLTYEEMWQVRRACLIKLDDYNIRVSILLRLRVQKEDGSFVPPNNPIYNERYEDRREGLWNLRLLDNSCEQCNVGSLQLVGDRITVLGCNVYSTSYQIGEDKFVGYGKTGLSKDRGGNNAELGMLALQLGNSEDYSSSVSLTEVTPFTLQLFTDNSEMGKSSDFNDRDGTTDRSNNHDSSSTAEPISNYRYRAQLDNIYTDFTVEEEIKDTSAVRPTELLHLMDQLE